MRKGFARNFILAIVLSSATFVPTGANAAKPDSLRTVSLNPFPSIGYNSDYGMWLGGYLDFNVYGGLYPNYKHRICVEYLHYSRSPQLFYVEYDSKYLIPGIRVQSKISYFDKPLNNFFGYGGFPVHYDPAMDRHDGNAYYSNWSKELEAWVALEDDFLDKLKWNVMLMYSDTRISQIDWKGYDSSNTLFRKYLDNGLVRENESNGGRSLMLKLGLRYDTRDHELNPTSGFCADANLALSPDLLGRGNDFYKLNVGLRQFISIGSERNVLAYHLNWQGTIGGNPAFYDQTRILGLKMTDGLGGNRTVRGVLADRLVGNNYLWANAELRLRAFDFRLLGRRIFLVGNPFADVGRITRPFRSQDQAKVLNRDVSDLNKEITRWHLTYGMGGQAIIDYNFIASIAFGFPQDRQDGKMGVYMIMDYIF